MAANQNYAHQQRGSLQFGLKRNFKQTKQNIAKKKLLITPRKQI